MNCPTCGAPVPWRHVSASGFFCPACRDGLRISANYLRVLYLLSGCISCLLAYAVGIRRESLFVVTFLAWWPIYWVVVFITIPLFPPDFETTGDYQGILYDPPVHQGQSSTPEQTPPAASEPTRSMFRGVGARRPVGEFVFAALALMLLVFAAWMALRPVLYRIAPEIGATYEGPATFPIGLHIRRSTLGITNGSGSRWTCEIELGVWPAYSVSAVVDAYQHRELSYSSFTRTADRGLGPEGAARESINARCTEPNGIVHTWTDR